MIPNSLVEEILKTNTCIFSVFNSASKGMKLVLGGKNISPFIHKTDIYMQYTNRYIEYIYGVKISWGGKLEEKMPWRLFARVRWC